MSECIVPSWNLSHQRRQVAGEEGNRSSSHVHDQRHLGYVVPMSNYEVAELTWENGQIAMQGLAGILPPAPAARSPTFGRSGDTLETIVHQATGYNKHEEKNLKELQETTEQAPIINPITAATSGRKRIENMQISAGFVQKRARLSASDHQSGRYSNIGSSSRSVRSLHEDQQVAERGGCASASATFYREKDATTMTWASFESPPGSFKTSKTTDEDSACHGGSENRDEELETKGETARSHPERRSRAALMHNQSERRRRDRINQKMKALQKLVPNASKTDKASMLDEVIEYLKQLQAQVHMMSTRSIPQMMMNPLAMQQQLQMALLSRMGMGVGLGMGMSMLDINSLSRTTSHPLQPGLISTVPVPAATPTFLPPHLALPAAALGACSPAQVKSPVEVTNNPASVRFADPYSVFLAQQAMNMDIYKMAALYRQQACKATEATSNPSQTNFTQRE